MESNIRINSSTGQNTPTTTIWQITSVVKYEAIVFICVRAQLLTPASLLQLMQVSAAHNYVTKVLKLKPTIPKLSDAEVQLW
jgi:hypothetical protein